MNNKVMLDTNIFDAILDGQIDVSQLSRECEYFVTHIQKDEIDAINDPVKMNRKQALLQIFQGITQSEIPTESMVLGVSRLGAAKLAREDNLIEELRKGNLNHTEDALIGETAIRNQIVFVTNDSTLAQRVNSLGGRAINFDQFMKGQFE